LRDISARSDGAAAEILRAGVIVIADPEWKAKPKPKVASRGDSSAASSCSASSTIICGLTANEGHQPERADAQEFK
jgi:hypothetical protein